MSKTGRMLENKMQQNIGWSSSKIGRFASNSRIRLLARLVVIVAALLVAYVPAMRGGFVWDDDAYVTKNPLLVAPDGLYRIWFSQDQPSQYFPMVYTSFRFEYAIWGLEPLGYHMTNIVLHAINALLLWWLLSRLGIAGAWLAAAVFALHPVHVESVAWITERKNVLMVLFSFLSLLAWMRFADRSHRSQRAWLLYVVSLLLYVLALLSKATACMLPVALVLLLWLKHIHINVKRWLQIMPYVLLGLAMGMLAMWWEKHHQGTDSMVFGMSAIERTLIASRALWFYIGKLLWPVNLAFSYPQWKIDATETLQYGWLLAWLIVAWCMWHWRGRLRRGPISAIIFFVATLLPMLGFISLYTFFYTYVADHYQYMASIGPIALVVAVGYSAVGQLGRWGRSITIIAAVSVLVTLGTLTWHQCHIYKDIETLWCDTLQKNPNSWMAYNNLGNMLQSQGKLDEAISHYRQALQIRPNYADARTNLGVALQSQGKLEEAISHFRRALQIKPDNADAHNNLGNVLSAQGKFDEAISHFSQALRFKPDYAKAHNNLGIALQAQGKFEEAISHFRKALHLMPEDAKVHSNLGNTLSAQGRLDEAISHFRQALQVKPSHAPTHYNLGIALQSQGKLNEAISHYRQALQIAPEFAKAHSKLGILLTMRGRFDEALEHFREAVRLEPDNIAALNGMAWILAKHPDPKVRDASQAIEFAERAAELTRYQNVSILDTLAAAYAAAGQFDRAVTTAQTALALASAAQNEQLANYIRKRLELYKQANPVRNSTNGKHPGKEEISNGAKP